MPLSAAQPNTMSIGSVVAPGIHPDLANDCSLMWSGVDLPLQPRPTFHNHLSETADDSPFYSSPAETCPSPLSDTTFSLPAHSSSSMSSTSTSVIDHYPKNIFKGDAHASPLQLHTPLLRWDADAGMPPSHLVPMSMGENLIQPVSAPPSHSRTTSCLPLTSPYSATTPLHLGPAPTAFPTRTKSKPCPTSSPSAGACEKPMDRSYAQQRRPNNMTSRPQAPSTELERRSENLRAPGPNRLTWESPFKVWVRTERADNYPNCPDTGVLRAYE